MDDAQPNPQVRAERTWFAVIRAYQLCTRRYEEALSRLDLTPSQFDVLCTVAKLGKDAQPNRIAEELLVTRSNVTGLVQRLVRRQWLRRVRNPGDGRSRIVRLTESGRSLLERARPVARAFIDAQMAPFEPEELDATRAVMERMEDHLKTLDLAAVFDRAGPETSTSPTQARLL